jgi:3-methyladenine DNA glycosylase AlkD
MTEAERLAEEIGTKLAQLPDPTTARLRAIRREYSRSLRRASPDLVVQAAMRLAVQRGAGCRFVAYEILLQHKAAFRSLTPAQILKLGKGIDSWSAVDCFGCLVSGPAWRDGQLPTSLVHDWTGSEDRWWRRAALVSTIALSRRAATGDSAMAVKVCALLASDPDDMVVKALSWALRELAKKHPAEARKFLEDHEHELAALVKREVRNKLETGLKNPRRS